MVFIASIDLRQDSSDNETCVAELLAQAKVEEAYSQLGKPAGSMPLAPANPRAASLIQRLKSSISYSDSRELAIYQAVADLQKRLRTPHH